MPVSTSVFVSRFRDGVRVETPAGESFVLERGAALRLALYLCCTANEIAAKPYAATTLGKGEVDITDGMFDPTDRLTDAEKEAILDEKERAWDAEIDAEILAEIAEEEGKTDA